MAKKQTKPKPKMSATPATQSRKKMSLNKRQKTGFSAEEKRALEAGIKKHGTSAWAKILSDPEFKDIFPGRTNSELKDKYRVGITPEAPKTASKTPATPASARKSPKGRSTPGRATRSTPAKAAKPEREWRAYRRLYIEEPAPAPAAKKTPAKAKTPGKSPTAKSPTSPAARRTPGKSARAATTPKEKAVAAKGGVTKKTPTRKTPVKQAPKTVSPKIKMTSPKSASPKFKKAAAAKKAEKTSSMSNCVIM